jgi:hypothetical protein
MLNEYSYNNNNINNFRSGENLFLNNYYSQNIRNRENDNIYGQNQSNSPLVIKYANYKQYKNNMPNNIPETEKVFNAQNNNYVGVQNNNILRNKKKTNNLKAFSVDNNNQNRQDNNNQINKIITENDYLVKENNEAKNQLNYYTSQIEQRDNQIKKLKQEINKVNYLNNNIYKSNIIRKSDQELEPVMRKNKELIEENEKLKLKIKNYIENEKKYVKDKIKNNINAQNIEKNENNTIDYWKNEYDKIYAENLTLKKKY